MPPNRRKRETFLAYVREVRKIKIIIPVRTREVFLEFRDKELEDFMKAMTRQQLASCAGVTSKTLGNYINRHWDELWALGMRPYEILPPSVVEWLSHHYCIRVDD
jgi:hypothetical protein